MPGLERDPIRLFDASIPKAIQEDWVRILVEAYPSSWELTRATVDQPEVRDTWPHLRRGKIESGVRAVAKRHGITTREEKNTSGNNHVVIEGERVFFTVSTSGETAAKFRPSRFREADALCNCPLFGGISEEEPSAPSRFNAILVHAPDSRRPGQLGRAFIAFPDPKGRYFADTCIDLMKRFPGVLGGEPVFQEDVISKPAEPEILPRANEGGA